MLSIIEFVYRNSMRFLAVICLAMFCLSPAIAGNLECDLSGNCNTVAGKWRAWLKLAASNIDGSFPANNARARFSCNRRWRPVGMTRGCCGRGMIRMTRKNAIPKRMALDECVWDGETLVCNLGTINPRQESELFIEYVVEDAGNARVTATLEADSFDPDPSNNSDRLDLLVEAPGTRLLFPRISNSEGQFNSIISVQNFAPNPAQISLTARRQTGLRAGEDGNNYPWHRVSSYKATKRRSLCCYVSYFVLFKKEYE